MGQVFVGDDDLGAGGGVAAPAQRVDDGEGEGAGLKGFAGGFAAGAEGAPAAPFGGQRRQGAGVRQRGGDAAGGEGGLLRQGLADAVAGARPNPASRPGA